MVGVGRGPACPDTDAFERKLFVIRKQIHRLVGEREQAGDEAFYVPSLSARTICFKGMMLADRVHRYYLDLQDERLESALALVHQRFSTNTFPSWELAQPFRYLCHNGEINTLRGNINWMKAREGLLRSDVFGDDLQKVLPVITEGGSDTATFDNVLEFLVMAGRPLAHAGRMTCPAQVCADVCCSEYRFKPISMSCIVKTTTTDFSAARSTPSMLIWKSKGLR